MKTIGERFDEMAEAAGVSKTDKSYYFGRSCCYQIATEQKAINDAELAEVKRERDEYYDEMLELRRQKVEIIEKACEWMLDNTLGCGTINLVPREKFIESFKKAIEE